MVKYYDQGMQAVLLGNEIARGGEGAVHAVARSDRLVAKIYHAGKAKERQRKVELLCQARLHERLGHVTLPIDALYDKGGRFHGFTMKRLRDATAIHQLYGSEDRQTAFPKADYAFMVRVAKNLAACFAELHSLYVVIGDINESGIFVTHAGTVELIDSDSFQVQYNGRTFRCLVGTPDYIAPELQGRSDMGKFLRLPNHDDFGLAVMIFRLLMLGRRPFAGRWVGSGSAPSEFAMIRDFRYPYSETRKDSNVALPVNAIAVSILPPPIRQAFDTAFGPDGVKRRPTAAEWIALLGSFERSLTSCRSARFHRYWKGLQQCPWCRLEQQERVTLFGPRQAIRPRPQPAPRGATSPPRPTPTPRPTPRPAPRPPAVKLGKITAVIAAIASASAIGDAAGLVGLVFGAVFGAAIGYAAGYIGFLILIFVVRVVLPIFVVLLILGLVFGQFG